MEAKKLFLFCCFLLLSCSLLAQKTKKIKKSHRSPYAYKEEFEVLKSDKKVKHGYYRKYVNGSLALAGAYENGQKVMVWQAFDLKGNIYYSFNHTTNKLVFFNPHEEQYKDEELDNPPILVEGPNTFLTLLYSNLKYSTLARNKGAEGAVYVKLIISEKGRISDFYVDKSENELLDEAALEAIESIREDVEFFPAMKASKGVESYFQVPIRFRLF